MKILVADDSATMRNVIERTLHDMSLDNLVMCDSAEKVLDIINQEKIDFILLDWHMGEMSGLECLKAIKGNEKTKNIPVIMLTVEQNKENIEKAMKSGADDYILKPLKPKILKEKLLKISNKYCKIILIKDKSQEPIQPPKRKAEPEK